MTQAAGAPRPSELRDLASLSLLKRIVARIGELHLAAYAAGLAYGAVFALMPTLALLVLLLGVFNATGLVARGMAELRAVLPADVTDLVGEQLTAIASTDDAGSFGFGALVSALIALWGASGAMRRVMEALNVVHQVEETRSFVRRLLVSIALAIGALTIIAATVVVMVVGGEAASRIFEVIGLGETAETVWALARWPILVVLAWVGIACAYRFAPAARHVGGLATPGTFVATIGWVGFSALFSWYVGGIGDMSATWGSVAGIVVFLLYLQYAGLIVLVGALVDVELFDEDRPSSRLRRLLRIQPTRRS
ncbi:MAG: putative ribonuclease [Thermoleophilia bacterium]|nr:putative ribonuclease [Thermoleophilia bacterium]